MKNDTKNVYGNCVWKNTGRSPTMPMEGGGGGDGVVVKKARLEGDRDVSEKIALGVHKAAGALGGGVDSRLYNQNAGLVSSLLWLCFGLRFGFFLPCVTPSTSNTLSSCPLTLAILHIPHPPSHTLQDSEFGANDEYTTYSKPMFDKVSSSSICRTRFF